MSFKKITSSFVFLLCFTSLFSQQLIDGAIDHDGEMRVYKVFLPSSYQAGQNLPMVLNLHGFELDIDHQIAFSEMNDVAEAESFIVVIPQGLESTTAWGAMGTAWDSYWGTGVDDLGFLNTLIDKIYLDYSIDLERVYCTGFSNGGYMSHRLGCELSNRVAAIASVAGSMAFPQFDNCTPSRPVPVLQINGTSDQVVAFNGIPNAAPSIQEVVDYWVNDNNCSISADTIVIPDMIMTDSSTVSRLEYNEGDDDVKVWFYIVENGGHAWPGSPLDFQGHTNQDFNASQHIWDFFNQFTHPNPDGVTTATKDIFVDNVKVFAHPNDKEIKVISDKQDIVGIQVFDLMGRTIATKTYPYSETQTTIHLSNAQNGIYVAMVETTEGIFSQKVLL